MRRCSIKYRLKSGLSSRIIKKGPTTPSSVKARKRINIRSQKFESLAAKKPESHGFRLRFLHTCVKRVGIIRHLLHQKSVN